MATRPAGPLFECLGGQPFGHRRIAGHRTGGQQAGGGVQVLGCHLEELGQRAYLVTELQARVPQRVPDSLCDVGDVDARRMHQHHVHVAGRDCE